jgi:hypothetical protein
MLGSEIKKKLCLFTGHGRGALKEVIDGFPVLQVIEKHLNWHPSPSETWGPAHALRVDPDDLIELDFLFHRHDS